MTKTEKRVRKKGKWTGLNIFCTVCLTILAILIVVPFWNAIAISFTTTGAYVREPFTLWPKEFTWKNYAYLVEAGNGIIIAYKNTIFVTLAGTASAMGVMVMAAYAFSREFPGKRFFFMLSIFSMYFGGGLIPMYLLIKNLHLVNNFAAVILMSLASVYNIIIMKNGFESIPKDLQEAAMIDGANDWYIFSKVMLPLQKPLLATFSLFTAVGHWNNWYWPMLIFNEPDMILLQPFLKKIVEVSKVSASFESAASQDATLTFSTGIQMACVMCVILPIMLVYPFLQKYFVKGVMVGAVKM